MDEKKFIVVDSRPWETYTEAFDTLEEADKAARLQWSYLTRSEREKCDLYVASVTLADIDEEAIDEETGEIDWCAWISCNPIPSAFNSDAEKAREYALRHEATPPFDED